MKKIITSTVAIFLLFTSLSFAGMCPMVNNQIKHALAKVDESAHPEIVSIAKSLKEQGMELHESGDHMKSEELLKAALRLLDL